MTDLLCELKERIFIMSLNRTAKNNAFDDEFLKALQCHLEQAIANPDVLVILLQATGQHFSAGADLQWMQRMVQYSEEQNLADALILAKVMRTLYECPKPTIVAVQGAAYGGGVGLIAACDIAIAARSAKFCFSEVKLGLIPAIISPYVVKALGERITKWLFMTAEIFNAEQAQQYNLIQHCVEDENLAEFAYAYAQKITKLAPLAVLASKALVNQVANKPINDELIQETATLIAKKRVSSEGQLGLQAFLNKETPQWN